jgi:sarcosine oxidase subunit gamma
VPAVTADLNIRPDRAIRRSPLHDWASTLTGLAPAVTLTEQPYLTHTTVWVDPASDAGEAISAGLGVPFPAAGTFTRGSTPFGDVQVLWMGPEEFLIISPEGTDIDVQVAIDSWLGGRWVAVVDVSAQRTIVTLSGRYARDVLAHGCSADLHPRVAPTGTCITTLLAQTGIVLQVLDAEAGDFQLLVRSSFAGYFATWVADAAAEYADPAQLTESL